jgi:CRISP-associated protein Cas1
MEELKPIDLKTILHSKRINIYYLEHCRVQVSGGTVVYITDENKRSSYWNIPIANTTVVLLGTGTSVTQAAIREFSKAGVLVGFCGGGGTPLYAGCEIEFLNSQSEYRPTEYLQQWIKIWIDDEKRLSIAKAFQKLRINNIKNFWFSDYIFENNQFTADKSQVDDCLFLFESNMSQCDSIQKLLAHEAVMTKSLYKIVSQSTRYTGFTRIHQGDGIDLANKFLNHGNYLAYGIAATACWVLGLPFALSVMHGKTRRGGLVFDVADIVKDSIVMPTSFLSAAKGDLDQEFRHSLLSKFYKASVLDLLIESVKGVCIS